MVGKILLAILIFAIVLLAMFGACTGVIILIAIREDREREREKQINNQKSE